MNQREGNKKHVYILRDVVHSDIMLYERFCKIINAVELLIYAIREEVHRFAIEYHRSLREKRLSRSKLDDIPGVGTKKKMILLKEFKSVKNIKEKTEEELSAIKGIDKRTAKNIVEYFDKKNPI